MNGGTCFNGPGVFSCSCENGYAGTRCEIDVKPCQYNQCQNGGSCTNRITIGDFGTNNQNGTNGSYNSGIGNSGIGTGTNGASSFTTGTFHCECPAGFEGSTCEIERTTCTDQINCQNGGTCYQFNDGSDNYYCTCPDGYSGTTCQVPNPPVDGSIRLVSGTKPWNGRLEIYDNGWKTICDDGEGVIDRFELNAGEVACRQLGFAGVTTYLANYPDGGGGAATLWGQDPQCSGSELRLIDCREGSTEDGGPCDSHASDVGIECRPF
ncbi:fibropellin-3-like [Littorina saxatilis]|uniref:fibropellin-3-like n=1 Tax=Littorina saxatilis TaxID=31220 RepID=UPI0038B6AFDD